MKNAPDSTPQKSSASKRGKHAWLPSRPRRRNGKTSSATTSKARSPSAAIARGRYRVRLERISKGWAWEMRLDGEYVAHGVRMGKKHEVIEHLSAAVDRLNNSQGLTRHAGVYK